MGDHTLDLGKPLKSSICLTIALLLAAGCTAGRNPPAIPAHQVAQGVPYLWPEQKAAEESVETGEATKLDEKVTPGINNGLIAIVNLRVITLKEFDFHFVQSLRDPANKMSGPELYEKVLDALVDRLLMLELAAQRKVEVSDEEVNQRLEKISENHAGGWEGYRRLLEENSMTFDDIRKQIRESLIVEQLERKIFAGLISPPPQQVLQEYQRRSAQYAKPELRDLSLIVVTDASYQDDQNKARRAGERILARLAKADFADVARETSEDEHAKEGGRQGFVRREDLADDIARVAFGLPEGGMSGLERMPGGYFVALCHAIKPAGIAPFEEIQEDLSQEMVVRMRLDRKAEALKKIRDGAFIRRLPSPEYMVYRKSATAE